MSSSEDKAEKLFNTIKFVTGHPTPERIAIGEECLKLLDGSKSILRAQVLNEVGLMYSIMGRNNEHQKLINEGRMLCLELSENIFQSQDHKRLYYSIWKDHITSKINPNDIDKSEKEFQDFITALPKSGIADELYVFRTLGLVNMERGLLVGIKAGSHPQFAMLHGKSEEILSKSLQFFEFIRDKENSLYVRHKIAECILSQAYVCQQSIEAQKMYPEKMKELLQKQLSQNKNKKDVKLPSLKNLTANLQNTFKLLCEKAMKTFEGCVKRYNLDHTEYNTLLNMKRRIAETKFLLGKPNDSLILIDEVLSASLKKYGYNNNQTVECMLLKACIYKELGEDNLKIAKSFLEKALDVSKVIKLPKMKVEQLEMELKELESQLKETKVVQKKVEKKSFLKKCSNILCSQVEGKEKSFKKCAACSSVYYCSVKCQRKDWKRHKTDCFEKRKKKEIIFDG